jgi:phosphoglycolate phosphatase-like HAD superfamily hydrolase
VPQRLVLFDIDGTLLMTAGAGRRAITTALRDHVNDPACFDRIRFDGKTDPQIMRELLEAGGHHQSGDEVLIAGLCRNYVTLLEVELQQPRTKIRLMPGVPEILDRLESESEIVLGLLTGNMAEGAALKLKACGIEPSRFRVGAYGSDSPHRPDLPAIASRRAHPHFGREPRGTEVVIIGDTPADMTCGLGISARAIGVATGSYPCEELAAAGAYAAFPDLSDTERIVEAILG